MDSQDEVGSRISSISVSEKSSISTNDTECGRLFETLLENIGGIGRYQKLLMAFAVLPSFFALSFIQSTWLFVTASPQQHWCRTGIELNFTKTEQHLLLPPEDTSCLAYDFNYSSILEQNLTASEYMDKWNTVKHNLTTTACRNGWNYDYENGQMGIAEEWDLVCEQSFLPTLAYTVSGVGGTLGILVGGFMADTYGRKKSYFVFFFILLSFGIAAAFSPNYTVFIVLITLQTVATNPLYSIPYTLGIELITPKFRATFSVLLTICFTAGRIGFTGVAYLLRNWRILVLVSTSPFCLFFLYWFCLPESPRWLFANRRHEEAKHLLKRIANVNRRHFDEHNEDLYRELTVHYDTARRVKKKETSWVDLLRGANTRRKLLLQMYLSCNVAVCYVGLNFYAPSLAEDPYLGFFLSSVIELPGSLLTEVIADRLGRRLTIISCLTLGCAACLGTAALPVGGDTYAMQFLTVFLLAKLFMTSAYTVQELMIYEAFPTEVRTKGVAVTTIVSYIISSFGPLITHFRGTSLALPMLIFGGLTVGGIVCVFFLPETLNCPLPETIEESEKFGKNLRWKDMWRFLPVTKKIKITSVLK
ncbi:carcinine transporter-like [Paramacrobiotus metropolitanus]|uniref:carcinine transporter-like n=1 Tax=Paramacrobiotus metropolitanus TaxID=2943436 RepID=UPI002445F01F|nr:carcinine transporter-like [Paramacrobiotus metropolitanus]